MKPIIGIVPLIDKEKESLWMLPGYENGIVAAGGIPIMLPLTEDEEMLDRLLGTVQGILLTGGQDVNPLLYGEEPLEQCGEISTERDAMEAKLLGMAIERDVPVLGICRGIQFLNAYLGGTLYQDLPSQHPSETQHHQCPPYDKPVHRVDLMAEGSLAKLLKKESLCVNSYHHQAIKKLADKLNVMAVSEDGITEAVEMPGKRFVWAVQWHPELSWQRDEDCLRIFKEFVCKASR